MYDCFGIELNNDTHGLQAYKPLAMKSLHGLTNNFLRQGGKTDLSKHLLIACWTILTNMLGKQKNSDNSCSHFLIENIPNHRRSLPELKIVFHKIRQCLISGNQTYWSVLSQQWFPLILCPSYPCKQSIVSALADNTLYENPWLVGFPTKVNQAKK